MYQSFDKNMKTIKSRLRRMLGLKNDNKVVNPKKHQNEFESFKKKLGKHNSWFLALDERRQWDLLFLWKSHKWRCRKNGEQPSLRNFIYEKKQKGKFFVSRQKLRESTLNQLIK